MNSVDSFRYTLSSVLARHYISLLLSLSVRLAIFLRRYPYARLFLLLYMVNPSLFPSPLSLEEVLLVSAGPAARVGVGCFADLLPRGPRTIRPPPSRTL